MKFWKITLITLFSFFGITSVVLNSSCNEDPCFDLKCRNGGTCANGYCSCPTGFEGPQCENVIINKYTGNYYGATKPTTSPVVIDSAIVGQETPTTVNVKVYSQGDVILGTVKGSNELIASPKSEGSFGTTDIKIETNWNGTGRNKMTVYVEKFVDNEKYVYTFTGETK